MLGAIKMSSDLVCCPYCGSNYGLYSTNRVIIDYYYDFDGNYVGKSDEQPIVRRKTEPLYCQVCNKKVGVKHKLFY